VPALWHCRRAGVTDLVELFRLRQRRFGPHAGVPLPDEEM
jgi:hypothetical protein